MRVKGNYKHHYNYQKRNYPPVIKHGNGNTLFTGDFPWKPQFRVDFQVPRMMTPKGLKVTQSNYAYNYH